VCSYCGCRALASIAQLTAEHEQIINLMGDVRRAAGTADPTALDPATTALAAALGRHTAGEELSLFAELRDDPVLGDHVRALCSEHVDLDAGVALLQHGSTAAAHDLEDLLRHHIDKEENGLFPAAAVSLDGAAWDRVDVHLADAVVSDVAVSGVARSGSR
jgi:hemerythrin-like domain-containing protein